MKRLISIILLLSTVALYAHNPKYQQKATSKPISVIKDNGFYIGLGVGYFDLQNSTINEKLSSSIATAIVGYDLNSYLSIEARYNQGITHLHYKGTTSKILNSAYSNLAIYAKAGYPIKHLKPYILIGYGVNKISNLNGSDRVELSKQYGVGVSYKLNDNISLFADYIRVYNKKGFDGRAVKDNLKAKLITIGATYNF